MRVLIADDHPLVRRGIRNLLDEAFPDAGIGEADDLAALMDSARRSAWDIVLLDLSMPNTAGLEGLLKLKRACPETPVLVLSVHAEEQYAVRALKAGAMGLPDQGPLRGRVAQGRPARPGEAALRELQPRRAPRLEPHGRHRQGPARELVAAGVPGAVPDRPRADRQLHRRAAEPERQDGEHLPDAHPREDGHEGQRGVPSRMWLEKEAA